MIKLIDNPDTLTPYLKRDLFAVRILSLLDAYGTEYDFCRFYAQYNDDGIVTAILSRLDGHITLSHTDLFNSEELDEFVNTIGYETLLCDGDFDMKCEYESGIVMKSESKVEKSLSYAVIDDYPSLVDMFNLDDYSANDFSAWYVDMSHRIRHGCARAYSLSVNDEIISTAVFSSIYNGAAVLTAVRTLPEFRKMGYASALVSYMLFDTEGDVYLMREKDRNKSFYEKLGFKDNGIWRIYR